MAARPGEDHSDQGLGDAAHCGGNRGEGPPGHREGIEGPKANKAELDKARELIRKAQWYWDYVAAENSMGFHNPTMVLNTLGRSIDLAHQAISTAEKASGGR